MVHIDRLVRCIVTSKNTSNSGTVEREGWLVGAYRRPRNLSADERGGIHDDTVAKKLGFRGGTVAGSIHMEQFPPLLMRTFGERWFETGGLSTYFRNATTDREPVRACVQRSPVADDSQIDVMMEKDDGTLVLEGTASIGAPREPSMLRRKLAEPRDAGELRILSQLSPCDMETVQARLSRDVVAARAKAVTEPLDWYTKDSPWGAPIVSPTLVVHLMVGIQNSMHLRRDGAVGLYGAIEVRHLNGPVFVEREYEVSGNILQLGTTPKTEYMWYETLLTDAATGADVASMLMMLRFMKASSPLWAAESS